jgi:hypothetical protein
MTEINKYHLSKIYKISSSQCEKFYIGSTTQTLKKRLSQHKIGYKGYIKKDVGFLTAYEIVKFDDCIIELIKDVNCENKQELEKIEGECIREYHDRILNKCVAGRTRKEYIEANKEHLKNKRKEYIEANKEHIKNKQKEYVEANKEHLKNKQKEYVEANKEHLKNKQKEYVEANKEHIKNKRKEYIEANKEHIKNKRKEYIEANKEHIKNKRKEYYEANKKENQ